MKKLFSFLRILPGLLVFANYALPLVSFAGPLVPGDPPVKSLDDLRNKVICGGLQWLYTFVLIFSVIMILIAAYQYITSQGNQEKVDMATKSITYAAVGVAVAILAKGIPLIVAALIYGGDSSGGIWTC